MLALRFTQYKQITEGLSMRGSPEIAVFIPGDHYSRRYLCKSRNRWIRLRSSPADSNEVRGSFVFRSNTMPAWYWNQHDKTKQTLRGEWIVTGDKCYQDDDGYFWYCGRSDDMLKVGGMWVSPVEVESTLFQHAAVLEAAVIGEKDPDGMTKPKAYVVLRDGYIGDKAMERELKAFVKDRIAPHKYPRRISFVSALPKTATGKIQRFKLRTAAPTMRAPDQ
jgi:acyl-coenzyme A synthetase/AMP-(fatty) acid ligase